MSATGLSLDRFDPRRDGALEWRREVPASQPFFEYCERDGEWHPVTSHRTRDTAPNPRAGQFSLLSWNIDFMAKVPEARMAVALQHLQGLVASSQIPCIIMLQEMVDSDLKLITAQPWIRSSYCLTDMTSRYWESDYYGTCTLIPKALPITAVFRVHYRNTPMERDALFVDIDVGLAKPIRLCNTHLESLIAHPPIRPGQLKTAARYMHDDCVRGSVLAGDLNAIQDFDKTLHQDNGLEDAYLTAGGVEGAELGFTWGHMARVETRERFGLGRLDKIYFCGMLELESFRTFGYGLEVYDPRDRDELLRQGYDGGWVTDHLGIIGNFKIQLTDRDEFST